MTVILRDLDALERLLERRLKRTPQRATLATLLLPAALQPALLERLERLLPQPGAALLLPFDGSPEAVARLHDLNVQRSVLLQQRRLILFLVGNPRDLRDLRTHTPDLLASPDLTLELHPRPDDRPWNDVDRDLRALMRRLYSHLDLNPLLPPGFSLPLIPWEELEALEPRRAAVLRAARAAPPAPLHLLIPEAPLRALQRERATPRLAAVVTWLEAQGIEGAHALHDPQGAFTLELEDDNDTLLTAEIWPELAHAPGATDPRAIERVKRFLDIPMRPPAQGLLSPAALRGLLQPLLRRLPLEQPAALLTLLLTGSGASCLLDSPNHLIAALLIFWIEERVPQSTRDVEVRLLLWQEARQQAAQR